MDLMFGWMPDERDEDGGARLMAAVDGYIMCVYY